MLKAKRPLGSFTALKKGRDVNIYEKNYIDDIPIEKNSIYPASTEIIAWNSFACFCQNCVYECKFASLHAAKLSISYKIDVILCLSLVPSKAVAKKA